MSKTVNVMIVGEGASEQNFVDQVLAPYLAVKPAYCLDERPLLEGLPRHRHRGEDRHREDAQPVSELRRLAHAA